MPNRTARALAAVLAIVLACPLMPFSPAAAQTGPPAAAPGPAAASAAVGSPVPPVAPRVPYTVRSPQGDRGDEYYWLRDDNLEAKRPEVMRYLEAENAYTEAVMAPLAGLQQQLVAEMRSRIQEDDSTPPVFDGGWWTWRAYTAGAEYPRLMRQRGDRERPDAKAAAEVMLDQPAMAAGKPYFRVASTAISPGGRVLAWTEDTTGRRIHTLRFKNLATGEVLADSLPGVLEDLAWANDGQTVFYIRQDPVTLQSGPVFRHRLGTPADADVKVFEEADKTLFVGVERSASRKFVLISVGGFDTSETRAVPADRPEAPVRVVLARRDKIRHRADHIHGRWFVRTNEGAVNFRLVSAPEAAPEVRALWKTLVPGREQATLENFALLDKGIALEERIEADTRVRLLVAGRSQPVPSAAGTSVALADNRDPQAAHLRYSVTSLVQPEALYDLHLASGRTVLRKQRAVPGYDAALYATQRLWAPARDGKRIPVTVAWRRDRASNDGSAPLLILGYGAYGLSYDPAFSTNRPSLLDRGFIVAIAHVRGGAELGERWYEDGRLTHKQNTFNDFVDATDALVKAGWGSRDKVFASGGSAGGLLMGAVANQAGRRYRGIALHVPFVDVVTTMLDDTIPLTANEWTQWGDPRQKAGYDTLLAYSPYDNIRAQDYPAIWVTTGLWDSQVQYYEPAKYVARLRATKTGRELLLLQVNMAAGHGGASGRFQALVEAAREYAFFLRLSGPAPWVSP